MHTASYPALRPRALGAGPQIAERFDRYESTGGEVTTTNNDAEILRCSGRADAFFVSCRGNGALLTFTDRASSEFDEVAIQAGESQRFNFGRSIVLARSLTAGAAATIVVAAAYAAPYERNLGN